MALKRTVGLGLVFGPEQGLWVWCAGRQSAGSSKMDMDTSWVSVRGLGVGSMEMSSRLALSAGGVVFCIGSTEA